MKQTTQEGQILLIVLMIMLTIGISSTSFLWFMNQMQARAGNRYRSQAALLLAEAGVHRALAVLESTAPNSRVPGREWRPRRYEERVQEGPLEGRFVLSIDDDPGGALAVTSEGSVGGTTRRIRARVHLGSPILLTALYGRGIVRVDPPPGVTFLLPYGAAVHERPWAHLIAGRAVWFAASRVLLNDPEVPLVASPGPADLVVAGSSGGTTRALFMPIRTVLGPDASLAVDQSFHPIGADLLRAFGIPVADPVILPGGLPQVGVNRDVLIGLASAHRHNAAVNKAAGRYFGDGDLERKQDSVYSGTDFARLLTYLATERAPPRLKGVIYVGGMVTLPSGYRLHIEEGSLVVEGSVHVSPSADLSITHSQATRTLPGLIVLGRGTLTVAQQAVLRVHGLVSVNGAIDAYDGAKIDVVGAVLGHAIGLSFRTSGATVIIRYDPAVLATPGLVTTSTDPVIAWVSAWEEAP